MKYVFRVHSMHGTGVRVYNQIKIITVCDFHMTLKSNHHLQRVSALDGIAIWRTPQVQLCWCVCVCEFVHACCKRHLMINWCKTACISLAHTDTRNQSPAIQQPPLHLPSNTLIHSYADTQTHTDIPHEIHRCQVGRADMCRARDVSSCGNFAEKRSTLYTTHRRMIRSVIKTPCVTFQDVAQIPWRIL